jgi:hypothetical protein
MGAVGLCWIAANPVSTEVIEHQTVWGDALVVLENNTVHRVPLCPYAHLAIPTKALRATPEPASAIWLLVDLRVDAVIFVTDVHFCQLAVRFVCDPHFRVAFCALFLLFLVTTAGKQHSHPLGFDSTNIFAKRRNSGHILIAILAHPPRKRPQTFNAVVEIPHTDVVDYAANVFSSVVIIFRRGFPPADETPADDVPAWCRSGCGVVVGVALDVAHVPVVERQPLLRHDSMSRSASPQLMARVNTHATAASTMSAMRFHHSITTPPSR